MKPILFIQKDWFKYAFYSSIAAFFIGISVYNLHSSWWLTSFKFYSSAPIGAFITCSLTWKWTFVSREDYKIGNVVIAGLISTGVSLYLTFVIEGLFIDYDDERKNILEALFWSFPSTLFSILGLGYVIFPISFLIGILTMKYSKNRTKIETDNLGNVS